MKYLETGLKDSMRNMVRRFQECRNLPEVHGSVQECVKLCGGLGIELLSSGSNISARIMSAKLE